MSKPLTIEEQIDAGIESVEQQYREIKKDISKYRNLLNQSLEKASELRGAHIALRSVRPESAPEDEEDLSESKET